MIPRKLLCEHRFVSPQLEAGTGQSHHQDHRTAGQPSIVQSPGAVRQGQISAITHSACSTVGGLGLLGISDRPVCHLKPCGREDLGRLPKMLCRFAEVSCVPSHSAEACQAQSKVELCCGPGERHPLAGPFLKNKVKGRHCFFKADDVSLALPDNP